MNITKIDIPCVWGGSLAGVLIKNSQASIDKFDEKTTKIIGIHGWLDNLNSLLPLAENLIDNHPNYEIYLYDRAGHGFPSHLSKGSDYSATYSIQDLRTIIQTLGWNKEKYSIIGHSYEAIIGMLYAACYIEEVLCLVNLDALPRPEASIENFFKIQRSRIDASLQFHNRPSRNYEIDLTFETAVEFTKVTRPGITYEAAKLLTERSIHDKLYFTRDESLKLVTHLPFTDAMIENSIRTIKAPILFIGASNSQQPKPYKTIDLLKKYHPHFEMDLIDGPHHLHMTHLNEVTDRIEQFFTKYIHQSSKPMLERSKL